MTTEQDNTQEDSFENLMEEIAVDDEQVVDTSEESQEADDTIIDSSDDTTKDEPQVKDSDGETEDTVKEQEAEEAFEFPQDWSAERKALFGTLSNEQKADILDINKGFQSDYTKKTQTLAEERRALENDANFAKDIKGVFDDNEKLYMQANGIEEKQAVNMAVANWRMENQDPMQFINQVAQRNGINLFQKAQELIQAQAEKTPEQQQLEQYVAPLQRQIQDLTSQISTSNQTAVENVLSKFTNAVDESGNSKYPHLEAVEDMMANEFTRAGKNHMTLSQEDWDRAYENACYSRPEIRESLLQQQLQAKDTEARKRVDATKASTVGKSIKSNVGTENKTSGKTFDELLAAI